MISLILSLAVFTVFFFLHVIIHRVSAGFGLVQIVYATVFLAGFIILVLVTRTMPLPVAAAFLYILLVASHFLFFFSFYFEGESPSVGLMTILKVRGPLKESQLHEYFSEEALFGNRLKMLADAGYIEIRDDRYIITKKGKIFAGLFENYRRLLRWDKGGL